MNYEKMSIDELIQETFNSINQTRIYVTGLVHESQIREETSRDRKKQASITQARAETLRECDKVFEIIKKAVASYRSRRRSEAAIRELCLKIISGLPKPKR